MKAARSLRALLLLAAALALLWHLAAAPAAEPRPTRAEPPAITRARERAEVAHAIYATTLEMLHRHYFRRGQAVLPARAMEDVFAEAAEQTKIEGRWLAVNTKAMSFHHEPKTDLEKQAVAALAAGQARFETVDQENLHLARPIPLVDLT